jgi:hypothetical protein
MYPYFSVSIQKLLTRLIHCRMSLFIVRCIATLNFSLQETTLFYNWVDGTAYDATHIVYDFTTMDQPG